MNIVTQYPAECGKNFLYLRCSLEGTLHIFLFPATGHQLRKTGNQGGFVSAAAKGLLYAVFAADLGNDLDGDGSALIILPPDKHTTKVAICRGTPKFDSLSASRAAVGLISRKVTKKCGKQESQNKSVMLGRLFALPTLRFQKEAYGVSFRSRSITLAFTALSLIVEPGSIFLVAICSL